MRETVFGVGGEVVNRVLCKHFFGGEKNNEWKHLLRRSLV